jgi:hypothetical protein
MRLRHLFVAFKTLLTTKAHGESALLCSLHSWIKTGVSQPPLCVGRIFIFWVSRWIITGYLGC